MKEIVMIIRSVQTIILGALILSLTTLTLFGQTERGAIIGTITDSQGAVVSGASVTIIALATSVSQSFKTNSEGFYEAPFLSPGIYKVSATASGFSTSFNKSVEVNVGARVKVDLTLQTGSVSAQVEISDSTPLVQTETATIGQVITTRQLTELPSGDRNIYSFLQLDSTVIAGPIGNAEFFRIESGGSLSISGTRPSSVTFKIDGVANTDPTFGTPTITPSLDSVKEFQLQNNAYSAEFEGVTQVNVASKGGTSQFHGSMFEFAQNDFFQPRNPLAAKDKSGKPGKNRLRFNQFGGTIGGPIWLPAKIFGPLAYDGRDKSFFFFSYEGRRNSAIGLGTVRVLTAAERSGDFSALLGDCIRSGMVDVPLLNPDGTPSGQCVRAGQVFDPATTVANPRFNSGLPASALNPQFIRQPFLNNRIPADRLDPTAQALINLQQPLPNFTSTSDVNFIGPAGSAFVNNQYSVRIDQRFSDRDNLYGRLTWQNNKRDNEAVLPYLQKDINGKGRVFNLAWTHVFSSSFVNELRLGYVRGIYGDSITEIDPTQFGFRNTTLNTLPIIGLTSGGILAYGGFSGSVLRTIQNTYQLADNISLTRGRHGIKVGFKADHNRFQNGDLITTNGRANFSGLYTVGNSSIGPSANRNNSIADFLFGLASDTSLNVVRDANLRNTPWALYAQDDWKVHRWVTVNVGVRYEYHQPFREQLLGGARVDMIGDGQVLVADPEVAKATDSPLVVCCTEARVVEGDKNDFGPRIGVAIQPIKNDNLVIRAGYGIFYADTSQFFHWIKYNPVRGSIFQPAIGNYQTPSATLKDLFPNSSFTPPTGAISVSIPAGVNPAALNNQPVVNVGALGDYTTPQSRQWSLSLQREVWKNLLVDLSYSGSVSRNLPLQWFFNQPTFSSQPVNTQSLDPAANPYLRRPYSNFSIGSNIVANVLESNYNALTVKVEKRFSQGYNFLSTYTWSKSIDQGTEIFTVSSNHAYQANNLDFNQNRGISGFNVPHRWVTSGIVELPFGKDKPFLNRGGWIDKLLGGIRFSGVFTLQSGLPFTPYILNRRTNTGLPIVERGDLIGNPFYSDAEWDQAVRNWEKKGVPLFFVRPGAISIDYAPGTGGSLGRNVFRAPYGRSLNLSAAKVTRLGEEARLELRVDMFNVTREVLHLLNINNSVAGANNLTSPLVGSIPARGLFFVPHTLQLGAKFIF
jgi:Carboxypeptidase regulatory-like domain